MKNMTVRSLLILLAIILSSGAAMSEQTKEDIAIQAAEDWLATVDALGYGKSWDMAASFFKNALPKEQWTKSMNAFRKPLGTLINRKLKSKKYMTNLPGAPDGEYVVIQFETSFENKKKAIETVTPMLDSDGQWKVSGYYIK